MYSICEIEEIWIKEVVQVIAFLIYLITLLNKSYHNGLQAYHHSYHHMFIMISKQDNYYN